jgi:hypothetical protein
MGKKRPESKRTDAERRVRQSERLSRLLRVLHCILGPGRWDADALAKELEVSRRTIHRAMEALAMANVPWYFCTESKCYRVRSGFKMPGVDGVERPGQIAHPAQLKQAVDTVLRDLTKAVDSLKAFSEELERSSMPSRD